MADYQLEIHHIDVGGGDCTAIVVKNLETGLYCFKALIDGGGMGKGIARMHSYLIAYIYPNCKVISEDIIKGTKQYDENWDFVAVSHYHDDHIKGLAKTIPGGKGYRIKADYSFNIGKKGETQLETGMVIYEENSTTPSYLKEYYQWVNTACQKQLVPGFLLKDSYEDVEEENQKVRRLKKELRGPIIFGINDGKEKTGIELVCVMANGVLPDGTNLLKKQKESKKRAINPNDQSVAWVIRWQAMDFYYFTAGDLSGDLNKASYYTLEPSLVNYLKSSDVLGKKKLITAQKVTHHGSEHSSYPETNDYADGWLKAMNPLTLILTANQKKGVPNASFIEDRLVEYTEPTNTGIKLQFVNNMLYPKSHGVYAGLGSLVKDAKNNGCNLVKEDVNNKKDVITNGSPGAMVIVLDGRQKFKTFQPFLGNQGLSLQKRWYEVLHHGKEFKHEVWEMKQAPGEVVDLDAEGVSQRLRMSFSDLEVSYIKSDKPIALDDKRTFGGFPGQAMAFLLWLKIDQQNGGTVAQDYILERFPLVSKQVKFPDDLNDTTSAAKKYTKVLVDLFDKYYIKGKYDFEYGFREGEINDEEEMTLTSALFSAFQVPVIFKNRPVVLRANIAYKIAADNYILDCPFKGQGTFNLQPGLWLKIRHAAWQNILLEPYNQIKLDSVTYSDPKPRTKGRTPKNQVKNPAQKRKREGEK